MKKQFQSNLDGMTLGGGSIEHPLSIHSASIGTRWKPRGMQLICTLVLLFTFAIGQMWGAVTVQTGNAGSTAGNSVNLTSSAGTLSDGTTARRLFVMSAGSTYTGTDIQNTTGIDVLYGNTASTSTRMGSTSNLGPKLESGNKGHVQVKVETGDSVVIYWFHSSSFSNKTMTVSKVDPSDNTKGVKVVDVTGVSLGTSKRTACTGWKSTITDTAYFAFNTTLYVYAVKVIPAPAKPTISGETDYTESATISLTATCSSGADASTTYTWYKGATWNAATKVQNAATAANGGNVFTKTAALDDSGVYWCEASNGGTLKSHNETGKSISVTASSASKYDITYNNTKGAANTNPVQYTEGIGVASFAALADVDGFHFTGWNPSSIAADAVGPKTINATWVPTYNVSFDKGAGDGTAPEGFQKWEGAQFNLPGQGDMVAPEGKVFGGWKVGVSDKYAAGALYTMGNTSVQFIAQWDVLVEQVIYSWEGAEGGATEVGGTVAGSADGLINQLSAGYYCLKIDGNNSYSGNLVTITLSGEEKVKTGDKITYWGFYNKSSSANARPKMRDANSPNAQIFDDPNNLPNLNGGGDPAERTFTVPAGINTNAVQLTRSLTGSNTWISKLQIVREKAVPEEDLRTVTFNTNGGSSITAVKVEKGTAVAKPADPTKEHCRFAGWQLSGSDYNFSSAVNSNITLDAVWTQLYTISFAAGEGSGDAPAAVADKAQGETFMVPSNTFTAPASKEFDKWNDGSADYAPGVTYTVGNANVTLTAVWKAMVSKYTIIFKDGETELGTKLFDVSTNPSDAEIDKTKPLYTFAAWQKGGEDIALNDAFWATVAKDATVTLTARWTKVYASSYDMEAYAASEGASKAGIEAALTAANYAYTNINGIDNGHSHNYTYDGLKYKTNDGDLSFNVVAGKVVEVKTGHLPSNDAVTMYINGVANATVFEGADESQETHKTNYFYSAAEALYRLEVLASKGTCSVKKITIRDPYQVLFDDNGADNPVAPQYAYPSVTLPSATKGTESFLGWFDDATAGNKIGDAGQSYTPTAAAVTLYAHWEAISTDNTLSDLKVGGVTVDGFDPAVHTYYYELPYGTAVADIPVISATANSAKAKQVAIQQAVWAGDPYNCYRAQANVQAEDNSWGYYDVRFSFAPKDGVSIIKVATTGGTNKTVTGAYAGDGDVNLSSSKKMDNGKYIGFTLDGTTLQAGDRINVHTTQAANTGGSHIIFYGNMTDKNELYETGEIGGTGDNIFVINAAMVGSATAYVYRSNADAAHQWNGYVDYIEVLRAMNPVLTAISFNGEAATKGTGDAFSVSLPQATTDLGALTIVPTVIRNAAHATTPEAVVGDTWVEGENTYRVMDKDGDYTDYTITITLVGASATPTIMTQPQSANYYEGASIAALSVVAESAAGDLSYQWQVLNGNDYEDIEGATAASYAPAISAIGSYTYRVVVTNLESGKVATSVESDAATIEIAADPACATFVAASIPTEEPYQYTNAGEWTIYNASSSGKRNGGDQVFGNVKDFEGNDVKGYTKERCVLIFEKDMKQIRFYSANAQRAWGDTPVRVSDDVETFLGTGTPSYSEYAATTSIIQADPSNNKEQIFIANGEFLAGKCYWFAFSGSLQIFQICAVEADPLADAPVFNAALVDEAICPGNSFATLDATAVPVTSYAWYKDGVVIDGATAATYAPTEAGTYYCIATNSAAGYRSASTKSVEAVLSVKEATSVTMSDISGKAAASIALNAVATGANPHYAWFTCDDSEGNNAVAIAGAADAASYAIPTPVATQYYKVVVTTDCGSVSAVALVTLLPDIIPLADVTESTVWDWSVVTKVADGSDLSGNGPTVTTGNGLVIANYLQGDNFDKIEGNNGAYSIRSSSNKFYQGASLHMHTTKGGILTIRARNEGHEMTLNVENEGRDIELGNLGNWKNYTIYVKAGDVTIYNVPAESTYPMRVEKITFTVKDAPDYSRTVSNNIGTLCVDHNVLVGGALGATFYQIASRNVVYDFKIDFEEVLPNEELKAGEPYIFQSTTGRIDLFYGETAVTEPEAVRGMHGWFDATAPIDPTKYDMLDITGDNMSDILYISQNKLWSCENLLQDDLKVVNNRAYIVMSEVPTYEDYVASQQNNGAPRRRVTMGRNGEQSATGFENLNASEKPMKLLINGQIFILRGEKMFDATGRLVK